MRYSETTPGSLRGQSAVTLENGGPWRHLELRWSNYEVKQKNTSHVNALRMERTCPVVHCRDWTQRVFGALGESNVCLFCLPAALRGCERCIRTATAVAALVWNPWLGILVRGDK